jgi:hypothetical protein
VALSPGEKTYAHERARRALREHFERLSLSAEVTESIYELHRVRYILPDPSPSVSVFVFGKGEESCREAAGQLKMQTRYDMAEFVPVVSGVASRGDKLDRAARRSSADILCFVEAGFSVADPGWLQELGGYALIGGIGAVGGRLLGGDGRVVGGGLIVGHDGRAFAAHEDLPRDEAGNVFRNVAAGNYSAVSVSLMATPRCVYEQFGGFDHKAFPSDLFSVDYCLKLWEGGKRVVFTPFAEMATRAVRPTAQPDSSELSAFRARWPVFVDRDPFVNPNLSRKDGRYRIDA